MRCITAARSSTVLVALFAAGVAAAEPRPPIDWSKDQAAQLARLQGSWIVDGAVNFAEALRFEGNRLTRSSDGVQETTVEITLASPCRVDVAPKPDGSGTFEFVVFDGDKLRWNASAVAVKLSDGGVLACTLNRAFLYKDGKCRAWESWSDGWEPAVGDSCTLDGKKLRITTGFGNFELLPVAGGGFLQAPASTGVRARDWAAAKAALRRPKR